MITLNNGLLHETLKRLTFIQNFQRLKKYGPWPKKRSSHAACVLNYDQEFPHLLVTGGLDENAQPLGDLWLLSVDHGTWNQVCLGDIKRKCQLSFPVTLAG